MKTVLLSTSSLWNCGDDFIREGVLELLNFKPDVRILWWNRGFGITNKYANDLRFNLPLIDYFTIAGTPQWLTQHERIYRYCFKERIPMSFIGVGTYDSSNTKEYFSILKEIVESGLCEAVIARDHMVEEMFIKAGFSNVLITLDPAFFMSPTKTEKNLNVLGWRKQFILGYDYDSTKILDSAHNLLSALRNSINRWRNERRDFKKKDIYDKLMLNTFSKMNEPKIVIIHDNREVKEAEKLFGSKYVYYGTDYRDILEKYTHAKRYIGSRIHGAIPSIINGAATHLVYSNSKAQVLEISKEILSSYYCDLQKNIGITYFNDDMDNVELLFKEASPRIDLFESAIIQEKSKIRNFLKETTSIGGLVL